jgi:hypothetical protein
MVRNPMSHDDTGRAKFTCQFQWEGEACEGSLPLGWELEMAQVEGVKSAAAPLGSLVKRIRPETQDERAPRLRPEAEIMKRRDDEEYPQQSQLRVLATTYNTLGVQLAQAQLDAKRGKVTMASREVPTSKSEWRLFFANSFTLVMEYFWIAHGAKSAE